MKTRLGIALIAVLLFAVPAVAAQVWADSPEVDHPPFKIVEVDEYGLFLDPDVAASTGRYGWVSGATPDELNLAPIDGQYHYANKRLAAVALQPDYQSIGTIDYVTEAQGCWLGLTGANYEELIGSVELPQGAEITGFWASIFDNTATGDVIVELRSNNPSGISHGDRLIGSGASTVDSANYQTVSATIDPPEVVGSQSEGGGLIALGGPETFYFDAFIDADTRICGLQVNYRIPASGDDLVFTPVQPCTIYDSRTSKGGPGPFATGEQRDFDVAGAIDLSSQGGPVGGCGIPGWVSGVFGNTAQAQALAIQVIAVNPTGLGSVKVWAGQAMVPDEGALLAYTGSDTFVSSAGIVPVRESCSKFPTNFCTSAKDMSVKVGASTEVKIVVTGYFADPPRLSD